MATHLRVSALHRGRMVAISDVCCRPHCRACGGEEWTDAHQVVFVRAGAFVKRQGRREFVADPNQVLFFNRQEGYRVSHPVDGGDDCTVFTFRPDILSEAVEPFRTRIHGEGRWRQPFEFTHAPGSQQSFLLHQGLRRFLLAGEADRGALEHRPRSSLAPRGTSGERAGERGNSKRPASPRPSPPTAIAMGGEGVSGDGVQGCPEDRLAVEEATLALLGRVLADAYGARGVRPQNRRAATAEAHREQAEATRLLLAARFAENLALDDIATSVHVSPFHLARIFRGETGLSLHQYRNRLRLRAALKRIQEGASDLTRLALDLGYASHSHFTDSFRRSFGLAPSKCRSVSTGRLRELSRNLEVRGSRAV